MSFKLKEILFKFRSLDLASVIFVLFSIAIPFIVSLSWCLREAERRQGFFDLGYRSVLDDKVQCDYSLSTLNGVSYNNSCVDLVNQTSGLIVEIVLIPIAFTLLMTFIARVNNFGELYPAIPLLAWVIAAIVVAFFGYYYPLFIGMFVAIGVGFVISLIQAW